MRRRTLLASTNSGDTIHKFVEIGGVKWATMNIGAETETDYGLYFQWGDTAGYTSGQVGSNSTSYKKPFYYSDYKFNGGRTTWNATSMTKYNSSDKKTVLDPSDDAARLHWGGDWRMPTRAEFVALGNAVTTVWTKVNGVNGLLCTDKTDTSKKLFFPAAGFCNYNNVFQPGGYGYCWSSSLSSWGMNNASSLYFAGTDVNWQYEDSRSYGAPVRPVLDL